jgi:hypothetical protein
VPPSDLVDKILHKVNKKIVIKDIIDRDCRDVDEDTTTKHLVRVSIDKKHSRVKKSQEPDLVSQYGQKLI